ncbi:MAG: dihydrodipicolinate reductase [Chloroflexaceae bacterium]|nr:dihydrodipicolinate reductase [Chloroflexaceae bacterium]
MEEDVRPIRVAHYGLGATGKEIARLVQQTPGLTIVGAIDMDKAIIGQDVGTLLELDQELGVKVSNDAAHVLETGYPDIVVLATRSLLNDAFPQIVTCLRARTNVVSTCEELVYPYAQPQNKELAEQLNTLALRSGVTLLGLGINPGMVMDLLPLVMTGPCTCIRRITVSRLIDATIRRSSLQQRIGAGLTPLQFRDHINDPRMRHVGLPESLHMIAGAIGWEVERIEEQIEPVITHDWVQAGHIVVAPGQVAGLRQTAVGFVDSHDAIVLDWQTSVGAQETYDSIKIDGIPPIQVHIPGGLHGQQAAAALVLHAIKPVIAARPGLLTVNQIPPIHYTLPALSECGWRKS